MSDHKINAAVALYKSLQIVLFY